jgi:hypothetical protein
MNQIFSILVRAAFTFVAFLAIQYVFHYMVLVAAGLLGSLFFWKMNGDRVLGIGVLIGTLAFGVFAYLYGSV